MLNKSEKLEMIAEEIRSLNATKTRLEREPVKTYTDSATMVNKMADCLTNIARIINNSF